MNKKRIKGFTLVELMVGFFVFALLTTGIYAVTSYALRASAHNAMTAKMQQTARLAMDSIVADMKNAATLPYDTNFSPQVPPSPVFVPFLTNSNSENYLVFSKTVVVTDFSSFQINDLSNYCLLSYFVVNPPAGSYSGNTLAKSNSDIASGNKSILRRNSYSLLKTTDLSDFFKTSSPIWSIDSSAVDLKTATAYDSITPVAQDIVELPFCADYIYFTVSHELCPSYFVQRRVDFNGKYTETDIRDPLTFKINMVICQHISADPASQKQEFKLDTTVNIKANF